MVKVVLPAVDQTRTHHLLAVVHGGSLGVVVRSQTADLVFRAVQPNLRRVAIRLAVNPREDTVRLESRNRGGGEPEVAGSRPDSAEIGSRAIVPLERVKTGPACRRTWCYADSSNDSAAGDLLRFGLGVRIARITDRAVFPQVRLRPSTRELTGADDFVIVIERIGA